MQKFKSDYAEFRKEFERIKEEVSENPAQLSFTNNPFYTPQRATAQRTELFSTSTSTPLATDARRRFASSTSPEGTTTEAAENPFRGGMLGASREDYALHEHSFLQGAEAQLDDFLAQGREVLDNLVDQRTMLKGTQRRLRDAANTLGLSRDVIGWIDRRRYAHSPKSLSHQLYVGLMVDPSYKYAGYVHLLGRRRVHILLFLSDMEVSGLSSGNARFIMHACCIILSSFLANHTRPLYPIAKRCNTQQPSHSKFPVLHTSVGYASVAS